MESLIWAAIGALLLLSIGLAYWVRRLYVVLKFIISKVHIVSPREERDPEMSGVRNFFGLDKEDKDK